MDGGGAEASTASASAGAGEGAAPVHSSSNHHANDHANTQQPFVYNREQDSPQPKSRPISLSDLQEARKHYLRPVEPTASDLEHYFTGPRDISRHTKWPIFLRMDGSILPRLILPLVFVAAWSSTITAIHLKVHKLVVSNILLTVLGFVVGLALSFRSTTAYERYADGRKYWASVVQTSRNMARTIWVHVKERPGEEGKRDVLGKVTALNLLLAFSVALKHGLRFEPAIAYQDLVGLVGHLDTFAKEAHDPELLNRPRHSFWKSVGMYLGITFAESNPRKLIKRAKKPLGHLSLEILNHLSAYIEHCDQEQLLKSALQQGQLINSVAALNEALTGSERVRDTPLPEAYSIAISQISWIYILVLPFQLVSLMDWIAIPGSIVAAYIILSFVAIGRELENPFGDDVNDLPLDSYCRQIASEIDIITATPAPQMMDFMTSSDNCLFYPLSLEGFDKWQHRSMDEIRAALRTKVIAQKRVFNEEAKVTKLSPALKSDN
ncbi:hypothetical protein TMatcc_007566 [Talaromyces marneffei ATCC 18224]|uniref:UPF0187 domain membrane protein n=2 Tax=Talaromyces marneffei TaxID=37727 RepID=B6QG79_TALMQ|nr:uncharacterized protein EYB26_004512 [Talaromyces marneffei]EEA24464.1 UPF0187 domain membrane protein [Talaromyces marneffei ATCC 18224]KAE8553027.1 hypothetical protein EYB25_004406 [Talaromyces marneffei]QGA16842.1 hypothetical protein EYB26_004512 [Talaromyces marneffei]